MSCRSSGVGGSFRNGSQTFRRTFVRKIYFPRLRPVTDWRGGLSSLRQDTAAPGPGTFGAEGEQQKVLGFIPSQYFTLICTVVFYQLCLSFGVCGSLGASLDSSGQQDPKRPLSLKRLRPFATQCWCDVRNCWRPIVDAVF